MRYVKVCEANRWPARAKERFNWKNTQGSAVQVIRDPSFPPDEWPFEQGSPITVHPGRLEPCDLRDGLGHREYH